jgi:hypothetical protein
MADIPDKLIIAALRPFKTEAQPPRSATVVRSLRKEGVNPATARCLEKAARKLIQGSLDHAPQRCVSILDPTTLRRMGQLSRPNAAVKKIAGIVRRAIGGRNSIAEGKIVVKVSFDNEGKITGFSINPDGRLLSSSGKSKEDIEAKLTRTLKGRAIPELMLARGTALSIPITITRST